MSEVHSETPRSAGFWIGWILTLLVSALFIMSGIMKLTGGDKMAEGSEHLGLPMSMMLPLGIIELTCVVLYLIPKTAVLGAILLTGYIGGAICTHWRVGDVFVMPVIIGIVVWLGIFLREPRLRALLPFRR